MTDVERTKEPVQWQALERLVEELIKERPRLAEVKVLMGQAGLVFSSDMVECLQRTLTAIEERDKNGMGKREVRL